MQARIYKPTKSTMQSGVGENPKGQWVLEYITDPNARFESALGNISSTDQINIIKLIFDSTESAVKFAQANELEFELIPHNEPKIIPKTYLTR